MNSSPMKELSYDIIVAKLKSNQVYLALDERKMGFTKKKRFTVQDARGMQTRVNLKFPEMRHTQSNDNLNKRAAETSDLVVGEFNRQYDTKFGDQSQVLRNRNVSNQSPFNKLNKPPKEYLEVDVKLPKNPTKIHPAN